MPRLDKSKAAMLFIDHQLGLLSLVHDWSPVDFTNSVLALADIVKLFGIPVILTASEEEGPNGQFWPTLRERFPNAPFIDRQGEVNAWDCPEFIKAVQATERTQLIIAGIVTEVCATFPALSAVKEGYEVFIAADACGTSSAAIRRIALQRCVQGGVIPTSWFSISAELMRDWRSPKAKQVAAVYKNRIPEYGALLEERK